MDVNIPKSLNTSWSFSTIQDFWRYYNNYPCPTKIFYTGTNKPKIKNPDREIASLSLFRQGIDPKWEHVDNSNGGEFALRNFNNTEDIDKMWEILSVYCIGELFEHSDQITGIRVVDSSIPTSKRVLHRIEIWFKSLQYKDHIEKFFRKLLNIEPFVQVHFKEHSTAVESFHNLDSAKSQEATSRLRSTGVETPTERSPRTSGVPSAKPRSNKSRVRKNVIRK